MKAVRTFVMAADLKQFQQVADSLHITQQAVSKRIAALESELGVQLLDRSSRVLRVTIDGQAYLPHARELMRLEGRARAAVQKNNRTLRIALVAKKSAPAAIVSDFQRRYPDIKIDVVTLLDVKAAIAALESGAIDATFRAMDVSANGMPKDLKAMRAYNEPHQLLVGPKHPLASARNVTLGQLAAYRLWIPGISIANNTEWAAYYQVLANALGLTIDATNSGPQDASNLVDTIAESSTIATLEGIRTRFVWPANYDLRRITLSPTPLYPHNLLWRASSPHPTLALLKEYVGSLQIEEGPDTWLPDWAKE